MTPQPADQTKGGLVCIGHAYLWHEGQLLVSVLRAAGLRAVLLDGQMHNTEVYANVAFGGARLMVPAEQAQEATDFINQLPPLAFSRTRWRILIATLFSLILGGMIVPPAWSGFYLRRAFEERITD